MVFVVKIRVWFNMNFLRINYLCFLLLITYWTNMYMQSFGLCGCTLIYELYLFLFSSFLTSDFTFRYYRQDNNIFEAGFVLHVFFVLGFVLVNKPKIKKFWKIVIKNRTEETRTHKHIIY